MFLLLTVLIPVLWFFFWTPVLAEMARRRSFPAWVGWVASPAGPVGAVAILLTSAVRSAMSHFTAADPQIEPRTDFRRPQKGVPFK